ncbi:MAG: endolytic transglycosylase MltG [Bacteroidota bacterium]
MSRHSKKNRKTLKYILIIITLLIIILSWKTYSIIFQPNISVSETSYDFAIPSHSTLNSLSTKLSEEVSVRNIQDFILLAEFLNLDSHIYPGLYTLKDNMSNKDIILLFRSGKRKNVRIHIPFNRFARDILHDIAPLIEANYNDMMTLLTTESYIDSLGFNRYTIISMFVRDTYFFHWNTSARDFFERMHKEYHIFWNTERLQKAQEIGLTPTEVTTLASIVEQETNQNIEKPRIAGVYLNRLRINMPLQADPTVKYAIGDFELKRVRSKHTAINSRYNTYKYNNLPPGPICTPSKTSIDAVLNHEKHAYLYFCAQPNYSGLHEFAKNYPEHLLNARKYQRWLNQEGY